MLAIKTMGLTIDLNSLSLNHPVARLQVQVIKCSNITSAKLFVDLR